MFGFVAGIGNQQTHDRHLARGSAQCDVKHVAQCAGRRRVVLRAQGGNSAAAEPMPLRDMEFVDYIDAEGVIPYDSDWGKVGVYAIFDENKNAVYFGKSRDVRNSLKMHLVRMPEECYYFKVFNFAKPSRKLFDDMISCWTEELGKLPDGNADDALRKRWENAIDIRDHMPFTPEEVAELADANPGSEGKIYKKIARRIQAGVEATLKSRNVTEPVKFDPKLKEKGLLDVASVKVDTPTKI